MAVGKGSQIFPSAIKFTSSPFKLEDELIKVQIVGWQEGDCVSVETIVGFDECTEKWVPYAPDCCGQLSYGYPQGQFFLNVPGRYRLVLSNRLGNHLTDPSWFENVEIFQIPVDGANISLNQAEGCGSMGCSQKIECDPLGIRIDGVLCAAPDVYVTQVAESAEGWNLVRNDAVLIPINMTSPDGTIDVTGGRIDINPRKTGEALGADEDATSAIAEGICDNADAVATLMGCLYSAPTSAEVCNAVGGLPNATTKIGG